MRSNKIVPIKYRNKCLIFSFYNERGECYVLCSKEEDLKSYYTKCSCWSAYCHEFKYGYSECMNYMKESKRGVIMYA